MAERRINTIGKPNRGHKRARSHTSISEHAANRIRVSTPSQVCDSSSPSASIIERKVYVSNTSITNQIVETNSQYNENIGNGGTVGLNNEDMAVADITPPIQEENINRQIDCSFDEALGYESSTSTLTSCLSPSAQSNVEEDDSASQNSEKDNTCFICMQNFTKKRPAICLPCENSCNHAPVHAKCIFNWRERPKGPEGRCPLCRSSLGPVDYTPPELIRVDRLQQLSARKAFVHSPIPKEAGVVKFYVRVVNNGISPTSVSYELFLQQNGNFPYPQGPLPSSSTCDKDINIMTARKRLNCWGCSQLDMYIDPSESQIGITKDHYAGTVQSSQTGLDHTVIAPYEDNKVKQLACVRYTQNRITKIGPRRVEVCLPAVLETMKDSDDNNDVYNLEEEDEEILETDEKNKSDDKSKKIRRWTTASHVPRCKSEALSKILHDGRGCVENNPNLLYAENKEPYWLEAIRAYSLDFQGRVTLPSNKNFQLLVSSNKNDVALQFGQVEESPFEIYTMDVQWPLSPIQAFGVCLSACDRKLICA